MRTGDADRRRGWALMFGGRTDRDWERLGRHDPYFGVLAHERYRAGRMTEADREAFFRTGAEHLRAVLDRVDRLFGVRPPFGRALDFGCGVGRVLLPLAEVAGEVVGVDVSPAMLEEARSNCAARGLHRVTLVCAGDDLDTVPGLFDLVHSYIVLQHVPTPRGERLFRQLLDRLAPGGVGIVHVTIARPTRWNVLAAAARRWLPLATPALNLARGRRWNEPPMEMNPYDLHRLLRWLHERGMRECGIELTDHGGVLGAMLTFRAPPA